MADNIDVTPGTGKTIAADDIGGALYQRIKLSQGADGSGTDVSSAAPLHITLANTGANSTAVKVDNSAVTQPISAASLPLPSGAATEAKQDTGNTSLAAIKTAVEIIDNIVSGSEAQVDIVAALPAGTNNIGDVDIASIAAGDNNIGNVDLASAIPAGTNNIGDVDIFSNTAKDGSGTRYQPLVDSDGHLQIDVLSGGGGGTQYTEGDTDASITGTAIMWEDGSDTLRAVSAAKPLPVTATLDTTGLATSAKQDTIIGHVDGIEGLLTTIAGDTTDIETAVELLDDTVTTLGTDTYTEATSKGITLGAVRRDADTTLVNTTNEFAPLQVDANGRLKVEVFSGETLPVSLTSTTITGTVAVTQSGTWDEVGINDSGNSITVDNGGTFAVQVDGNALTALQLIDDIVYTDDTSTHATGTSKGALLMAAATPSDASVNANDIGAVGMTTDRKLHVAVMDALPAGSAAIGKLAANSGVDIGDVDVTSVIPGTGATNLGKAEDGGHTTGDVGIMALGVRTDVPNAVGAGTTADYSFIATDMAGGVRTALYETDFAVLGTSHVKKYYTNSGAVTDGIVWSPAAGKRWYVTDLIVNTSAAATITFEDDKAGGDEAVMKFELAANSGIAHSFKTPWFSGEDAADLIVTTSAGNVYITITGYEI